MEHSALGSRESIELRIKGMTDQFDIAESVDDVLALQYRLYSFLGSESARAWTLAFMDKGQEVLDFMDKTEAIAEKALDRERDRELTSMTEGAHAKRSGDPDRQVAAKGSLSSERRRDRQVAAKDSLSSERRRARPAPVADKKREDSPRLLPRDATASQSSSSVPSTRICFSSIRPSTRPVHSPTSIMHGACKDTIVWREAKHRRSGSSTTRSQHRRSQQRSREPVSGVLATPITNNVMKPRESTPLAHTPAAKARCADRRGECVEKHKDAMSPARRGTTHGARSALGPVRGKRSAATWSARGCEVQKNVIPTAAHAGARTRQRSGSASRRQSATSATSVRPESAQPEVKRRKKSAERGTSSASADARRDGRGESTRVPQKENHAGSPGNSRSSAAGPAPFAAWLRPRPTLWHQRSRPAQLRSSGIKAVVPSRRSVNVVRKPKVLWSAAVSQPRKGKWTKGARRTISTGDRACSVYGPASVRELTEKEVTNGPALRERKKRVREEEGEEEFEEERRKRDDGWTRTMREQDEDGREETRKSEQERWRDKEEERQRAENEREAERKRANKIRRDDEEEEERQRAENEREEERKRLNKIQKDEEEERQRRENERADERKRINQIRIDEEEERQRAENEREEERKRLNLRRDDEEERQRRANAREEERKRERLRDEHEKRRRREWDDEEQEKQKKHEEGKWREREKKKKLEAQAVERRKEEERMALERQKQEEERKEKERGKLTRQKEEEERKEKERKVLKWHREEEERKEKEWEALERQKDQMELEKQKESDRQREREGRRKQERNAEAENTKVVNKRRKEDKGEPEADGKRSANLEGNGSADSGRENEAQEKRKNETTTEDKTERRRKRFEVRITEAEKFVKKAEDELDEIWRKHRSVRDMCAEPAELKLCIDNARLVVGKADGRLESLQKLLDATNTFRDVVVKAIDTIKPRLGKVKRSLQELEDQCKEIIETTEDNTPSESAKEVEQRPKASKNEFRRKTATLQKLATRGVILVSLSDSED